MPILTLPLESDGAIIEVSFTVSAPRQQALLASAERVPQPVFTRALIDTGASGTCIDPSIIARLGLEPTGTVPVLTSSTGSTPVASNQFDVALFVMMDGGHVHVSSLIIPAVQCDLSGHGFQALIGRDVLDQGMLIYDGRRRQLTLAF